MDKFSNSFLDLPNNSETFKYKIIAYLTLILPFLGFLYLMLNFRKSSIYLSLDITLFIVFYFLSTIGISVGFHRGFAHKSYLPTRGTKISLAILGSMAAQGNPIFWVATHRRHHIFSDTLDDIHSPHVSSSRLFGFFYAHIIWMIKAKISNPLRFAKNLILDSDMHWVSKNYFTWVLLGIVLPGLISTLIYGTLQAFLEGILWGGLVRILIAHHVTWSLNSLAHIFGKKRFKTDDHSHNLSSLAIISIGESWHNNHHAFPYSAKFGLLKRQIDIGYLFICILERFGLISNIKIPSVNKIESQLI